MERKTHILFTITGIYGLATLFKNLGVDNSFTIWYITLVASFPLISIPFQIITTTLPDSDHNLTRLKKTILYPAIVIIQFITNHRGATHDIRGISIVGFVLYLLHLIGTNIIILALFSFLAITILIVLIDDFRIKILGNHIRKIGIITIPRKFLDILLSSIILIFFPILLIPEVYNAFLISIFFAYIWHMFGDMPSKEGWKPLIINKSKIQFPIGFRVGGVFERKIIRPILRVLLVYIIWIDRDFLLEKIKNELLLVIDQYKLINENPEILVNDYLSFKEKIEININGIKKIFNLF